MKTSFALGRKRCSGQVSGRMLAAIAVGALLVFTAIYLLFLKPEAPPIPIPVPSTTLETVAPAESKEERGDTAREVIAELRESPGGIDYARAYDRAREFQASGQFANAQILYFFAARGGNSQAAFDLATMHDPNQFSKDAGLMDEPDPFQAYKWYLVARDSGNQIAVERLKELRSWAEGAAADNDPDAELLLMQWE